MVGQLQLQQGTKVFFWMHSGQGGTHAARTSLRACLTGAGASLRKRLWVFLQLVNRQIVPVLVSAGASTLLILDLPAVRRDAKGQGKGAHLTEI